MSVTFKDFRDRLKDAREKHAGHIKAEKLASPDLQDELDRHVSKMREIAEQQRTDVLAEPPSWYTTRFWFEKAAEVRSSLARRSENERHEKARKSIRDSYNVDALETAAARARRRLLDIVGQMIIEEEVPEE